LMFTYQHNDFTSMLPLHNLTHPSLLLMMLLLCFVVFIRTLDYFWWCYYMAPHCSIWRCCTPLCCSCKQTNKDKKNMRKKRKMRCH
jgi:uncharacterized membrane protein